MDYEWTEWMDAPMGVPCPVRVGEIVEIEYKQIVYPKEGVGCFKLTQGLQKDWTKSAMQKDTSHIIYWKYRVKKPNTKKWLESLETEPEADLVKG